MGVFYLIFGGIGYFVVGDWTGILSGSLAVACVYYRYERSPAALLVTLPFQLLLVVTVYAYVWHVTSHISVHAALAAMAALSIPLLIWNALRYPRKEAP